MKKILVAVLVAAASFSAAAQVTISGKGSAWFTRGTFGTQGANFLYTEPTSNINITAKEDLGSGLSARAVLETSIAGNTYGLNDGAGTQLGDRQATVGLASKVGSLDVGRNVHSQFLSIANNDPFGTMYGSIAGEIHDLRGLRMSNGMFATAQLGPNIKVAYDYSNRDGMMNVTDAKAMAVSASFAGVNATVARYENGVEKSTVVGGNAKLGATTVFYSHSDNEGALAATKKKGDLIGVSQAIGRFTAKASYGRTNTDIKGHSVGLDYALSKRTEVGIAFAKVDPLAGTNKDASHYGVGLTHRF